MKKLFTFLALSFALVPLFAFAQSNPGGCYIYTPEPGQTSYICPTAPTIQPVSPPINNIDLSGSGSQTNSSFSYPITSGSGTGSASSGTGNTTDYTQSLNDFLSSQQNSLTQQINQAGQQNLNEQTATLGQQAGADLSGNPTLTQCQGTGSTGGALSNILAGNLNNILGNLLGQKGSQLLGSVGGVNGLLGILNGSSGVNAGALLGGLTGNNQIGGLINQLLGSGGNINLGSLLNGGGLGSLLSGSGGIGSLLGGSGLSSVIGGIPGLGLVTGALGAGAIPVDTVTGNPLFTIGNQQTKQIQNDQDTLTTKTCVQDLAVKAAANQAAAQFSQTVIQQCSQGNGGAPCWAGAQMSISQENAILGDTVFNNFVQNTLPQSGIDQSILSQVQQNLVAQRQQNTNLQNQLACPIPNATACAEDFNACPGTTAQDKWNAMVEVIAVYPQCTASGATSIAQNAVDAQISTRIGDRNLLIQIGNGVLPPITCLDASGNSNVPDYQCVTYRINTAPPVSTNTLVTAVAQGEQKQASANQIGQLVNSLFANLAQTALTSLTGMIGLSQSQNGQPSYLNQLSSGTNAASTAQSAGTLKLNIENSIALETSYESTLSDVIATLTDAQTAYTDLSSCLKTFTGSTIGSSTPSAILNISTTTLATVIQPQLTANKAALANSNNAVTQLASLDGALSSAQNVNDLNTISDAYQALISSGALHTQADLQFLTSDYSASQLVLGGMTSAANTFLSTCQSP